MRGIEKEKTSTFFYPQAKYGMKIFSSISISNYKKIFWKPSGIQAVLIKHLHKLHWWWNLVCCHKHLRKNRFISFKFVTQLHASVWAKGGEDLPCLVRREGLLLWASEPLSWTTFLFGLLVTPSPLLFQESKPEQGLAGTSRSNGEQLTQLGLATRYSACIILGVCGLLWGASHSTGLVKPRGTQGDPGVRYALVLTLGPEAVGFNWGPFSPQRQ